MREEERLEPAFRVANPQVGSSLEGELNVAQANGISRADDLFTDLVVIDEHVVAALVVDDDVVVSAIRAAEDDEPEGTDQGVQAQDGPTTNDNPDERGDA